MYFILRLIVCILNTDAFFDFSTAYIFDTVLYAGCSLMIALVRPYKRAYMNIIDALILGILALLALTLKNYFVQESSEFLHLFYALIICIFGSIPLLGLAGFIAYKILKRLMKNFKTFSTCLLYTSPSPRDATLSRMPSSA